MQMVSHVIVSRGSGQLLSVFRHTNRTSMAQGPLRWVLARHFNKCRGPRRHPLKEGRLRHQAIKITSSKKVKAWRDAFPKARGISSNEAHTRPEPRSSQRHRPKSDPIIWEAHQTRDSGALVFVIPSTKRISVTQGRFFGGSITGS